MTNSPAPPLDQRVDPRAALTPIRQIARRKLSDRVVEEIKHWMVEARMKPGDRLPQERELMRQFGVSKGTMRESLKALEVQGIVRITTGPRGGAAVAAVSDETMAELLGNYFYFKELDAAKIYQVRKLLEPELAASVVGRLTEGQFARLEQSIAICREESRTPEARRRQRIAELAFHDILAQACPNPALSFTCRFINRLLSDLVVFKKIYVPKQKAIAQANIQAHADLMEACRRGAPEAVRAIMRAHMLDCEQRIIELEAVVESRFLDGGGSRRPGGGGTAG